MTEHDWLKSTSPNTLLHHLRPWGRHRRKLWLYVCGWYRHSWRVLNEPCRRLIERVERVACGLESSSQLAKAKRAVVTRAKEEWAESGTDGLAEVGPTLLRQLRLEHLPGWEGMPPPAKFFEGTKEQWQRCENERAALETVQLTLLRDIMGNPFHPPNFDPSWCIPTVVALACAIDAECAFDRLPLLADALQGAGCDDAQLLMHCRSSGPHTRGCWAVDLVLERR